MTGAYPADPPGSSGASAVRLRRILPSELSEAQEELYREITQGSRAGQANLAPLVASDGALEGPFNAMLLSPRIGRAVQAVGAAIRFGDGLSPKMREIAVLAVAAHWGSAFELHAHHGLALQAGLTEGEVAELSSGRDLAFREEKESVVLATTRAMVSWGNLDDLQYETAVRVLGEPGLFDLSALVGYYSMLALQLKVFGVDRGA